MERMHAAMEFNSRRIGRAIGVDIKQPFLDKDFVAFSRGIGLDLKIRDEEGKRWGKWILRAAFAGILPPEILWQAKRPLEYGSGMTQLRGIIDTLVTDEEFEEGKRAFPVRFWNKEHFYYYRLYREVVGEIPPPEKNEEKCGCCGAGMPRGGSPLQGLRRCC